MAVEQNSSHPAPVEIVYLGTIASPWISNVLIASGEKS
jgi:hypothetical protein